MRKKIRNPTQKLEKKSAARKKWKKKISRKKMKKLVTEPVLVRASVVGITGRLGGSGTEY
jgi:hypothetical protein